MRKRLTVIERQERFRMRQYFIMVVGSVTGCFILAGCATTVLRDGAQPGTEGSLRRESAAETVSALKSVTQAVSGRELSDQDLRELNRQLQQDPETESAVRVITETMQGGQKLKYCPVCGKRYHPKFEVCPVHQVPLKEVED